MHQPDASTLHDPQAGPTLVAKAVKRLGSRKAVAARVGLSSEQLRLIANRTHDVKYPLQYMLECIVAGHS